MISLDTGVIINAEVEAINFDRIRLDQTRLTDRQVYIYELQEFACRELTLSSQLVKSDSSLVDAAEHGANITQNFLRGYFSWPIQIRGQLILARDNTGQVVGFNCFLLDADSVIECDTAVSINNRNCGIGTRMLDMQHQYLTSIGIDSYHAKLEGGQVLYPPLGIVPYLDPPNNDKNIYWIYIGDD